LLFDASQRANRYISNRMWHSDPSWLHRMLELLVAPNMRNLIPAVLLQAPYDFSAGHKTRYTLSTHLSSRGLQERPSGAIGWLGAFVPGLQEFSDGGPCGLPLAARQRIGTEG